GQILSAYLEMIEDFGVSPVMGRLKAGLLRRLHVKLIGIALQRLQQRLEACCKDIEDFTEIILHESTSKASGGKRHGPTELDRNLAKFYDNKMKLMIEHTVRVFDASFLDSEFRSERLEILLCRYLNEDSGEVGAEVGKRVWELSLEALAQQLIAETEEDVHNLNYHRDGFEEWLRMRNRSSDDLSVRCVDPGERRISDAEILLHKIELN